MNNIFRKTPIFFAFLSMSLFAFCYCSFPQEDPENDDKKIRKIIKNVRQSLFFLHYSPQAVNDEFSQKVFSNYIESLDPAKRYLLQSDIDYFKKDLYNLDNYFNEEKLNFYYSTVDTIYARIAQAEKVTEEILEKPFHFKKEEKLVVDQDLRKYAKDRNQLKEYWKQYLKYSVLIEILSLEKDSTNARENITELEKKARKEVSEYTSDYFRRLKKRKKSKYLSGYINSFTSVYDPHTTYFSPIDKKGFDQSISGRLEGIGARLQDKKGYATITELIVGGPAWKSNEFEVGDQITKVQQGEKGEPVNIVGMLLEESIELIKGKKGTEVILTIKKKDGETQEITLIRDVIEISETFARSAIIQDENGDNFGLIYLPEFYIDFNNKGGRDASDDIAREIEELKKQNIKGLVFDLRNNGGGSLQEVVEIVGHFIENGPVVQVKSKDGMKKVHKDSDSNVNYEGEMVVLVNELSASASEIMAAALQDYHRAIVIGSKQTFGKGTVQSLYPLNRFTKEDYGAIKMTVQKYYRINGGSTQRNGVNSDIIIPSQVSYEEYSEASQENALEWDRIQEADYKPKENINYDYIIAKSKSRLQNNSVLELIGESADYLKQLERETEVSLSYKTLKEEREKRDAETEKFKALDDYKNQLKIESPNYELEQIENDTILETKREKWHKSLNKDFYLQESINVLNDMRVKALLTDTKKRK